MKIENAKEKSLVAGLTMVASIIGSIGIIWPVAQKVLAQEVKEQIQPLSNSFEVIMVTAVRNTRNAIAAMEFKRDMCAEENCWTVRDEQDLAAARAELLATEQALQELRNSRK
jgi:hypothetical protein